MPSNHKFTDEERVLAAENQVKQVHRTKSWYMKQLMAIADGERKCDGTQLNALKTFADIKGWHGPKSKRNVISKENLRKLLNKSKPVVSDELMNRMAVLVKSAEQSPEQREQLRKEQA